MDTALVTVEFTCSDKDMVGERIESVRFERYGMTHKIMSVEPGRLADGTDECDLPDYRRIHDLPASSNWVRTIPEGCVSYLARVRLEDTRGEAMMRDRVLAVPFGDRDLGFMIDQAGEAI